MSNVIIVKRYTRSMVRAMPDAFFVFGDNSDRYGLGGQAAACRGEPNTLGICTKYTPGSDDRAYFSDDDFEYCRVIMEFDLKDLETLVKQGTTVVFPEDGIGTGRAEMADRAPRCWDYLQTRLKEILGDKYNVR